VPYQVTISNPNTSPGRITALTDSVGGSVTAICPNLINTVLAPAGQPGDSAVCNFNGSVPSTTSTDTASVTLSVNGLLATNSANSTVFPPVLGTQITPPIAPSPAPTALAFTGAPIGHLTAVAGMLLAVGGALFLFIDLTESTRRRRAQAGG
jgi:hypothetical protein